MKILVTGGAGFIGSNFIRYWVDEHRFDSVLNLDALTYAGNPDNLNDIQNNPNYSFVQVDICDSELVDKVIKEFNPDIIVNFAAESHNSLAIINPTLFFRTNVLGTQTLLEAARKNKTQRFHHISTCEVYGDLALDSPEKFTEENRYDPNTPYNASKGGADLAAISYFRTFGLPVTVSNCCNNYGPYQFPEKLIPLFVTNLLEGKQVPVYTHSQNKREWIHVLDHCRAIELILRKGRIGETYNVGTGIERSVEEITDIILKELNQPDTMKKYVEDRPSHDRRYLLDSTKIMTELGWRPYVNFEEGLIQTIQWYVQNPQWWQSLKERLKVQEDNWKK